MIQVKDLGYSVEQVCSFLHKMEYVNSITPTIFNYYDLTITLSSNRSPNQSVLPIARTYMELNGPSEQQEEFYKIFLLNHMTMGG